METRNDEYATGVVVDSWHTLQGAMEELYGERKREGKDLEASTRNVADAVEASLPYIAVKGEQDGILYLKEQIGVSGEKDDKTYQDATGNSYIQHGDGIYAVANGESTYQDTAGNSYIRHGDSIYAVSNGESVGNVIDEDAIRFWASYAIVVPRDCTPALAAMVIADMVKTGALERNDAIEHVAKPFASRFDFSTGRYGDKHYEEIFHYNLKELRDSLEKAFHRDPDLYLDIVHSGSFVHRDGTIFTNDVSEHIERHVEEILEEPTSFSCYLLYKDAEEFYQELLGNRYEEDMFQEVRDAYPDADEMAVAFLDVADENLRALFKEKVEKELWNDYHEFIGDDIEQEREQAEECLKAEGFLKDEEVYLIFGGPCNYRGSEGAKIVDINSFSDIEESIAPDCDYRLDFKAVPGIPYFEATLYHHDVPTGGHFYILPESKWDALEGWNEKTGEKGQGYQFLQDVIEKNEFVRDIFKNREAVRTMDREGKTNKAAKLLSVAYHSYFSDYQGHTADTYNSCRWEDAMYYACERLSMLPEVQANPTPIAKAIEKFNPALLKSGEGAKEFLECVEKARHRSEHLAKQKGIAR